MMLTPRIPSVSFLALRISSRSTLLLASSEFLEMSGSLMPGKAAEMTPIPPSRATAEAKAFKLRGATNRLLTLSRLRHDAGDDDKVDMVRILRELKDGARVSTGGKKSRDR